MVDWRLVIIAIAELCSGAILGASIPTETERKVRGGNAGWALFSNGSLVGIVFNQIIWLIFVGGGVTVIGVGVLRLGNAYPLLQEDRYFLACALVAGAVIAKWTRYRYWKSRSEWR